MAQRPEYQNQNKDLFELHAGDTPGSRMKDFEDRLRRFTLYAERERGAWGLFTRVAMATLVHGDTPLHDNRGEQVIVQFPPINYELDPTDSETRRQIVLKAERLTTGKKVTAVTPWLEVYTMGDVKQFGLDPDHANPAFVRGDLEVMSGHRDWSDSAELFETMLNYTSTEGSKRFEQKFAEQTAYISWLRQAAAATDTPLTYHEPFATDMDVFLQN